MPKKLIRGALSPMRKYKAIVTSVDMPLQNIGMSTRFYAFERDIGEPEHIVIEFGHPNKTGCPLVRLHSECLTGDLFGSLRCDCGLQLQYAIQRLSEEGGYLIYLRQEGRGIGLHNKLRAYSLQDSGLDTFEANLQLGLAADSRDYQVAAEMLMSLGVHEIQLMTNNPEKERQLSEHGVRVQARYKTPVYLNPRNHRYLSAKLHFSKHDIQLTEES